jgi:hypothetical protein
MDILIFLTVAVASYYVMSIVQTVLHKDFGHRRRIRAVFSAHAIGHHGLYNKDNLQTETFEDCESHALNYYGIPIVVVAILTWARTLRLVPQEACAAFHPPRRRPL